MNDEKGAMVIVVYLWFGLAVVCFVTIQVAEPQAGIAVFHAHVLFDNNY